MNSCKLSICMHSDAISFLSTSFLIPGGGPTDKPPIKLLSITNSYPKIKKESMRPIFSLPFRTVLQEIMF